MKMGTNEFINLNLPFMQLSLTSTKQFKGILFTHFRICFGLQTPVGRRGDMGWPIPVIVLMSAGLVVRPQ
jgi:hypothetical protein